MKLKPFGMLAGLVVLAALRTSAAEPGPREKIAAVTVEKRFAYDPKTSAALDVRWAGRDSIYLLRHRDGVTENRLTPGLPWIRSVLPGGNQIAKVQGQTSMALSRDVIASASVSSQFVWAKIPTSGSTTDAQIRRHDVSVSDFDFVGDDILLLGYAGYGDGMGGTFLWTGSLESNEDLQTSPGLEKASSGAEVERRGTFMGYLAGSLRALPNGDRVVFPGYDNEVRLVSSAGKEKAHWDLAQFGVAPGEKLTGVFTTDQKRFHGQATAFVQEWLSASSIVDDVLFVGKTPALIVRESNRAGSRWLLVLLETDRPRVFSIPVGPATGDARLRADGNQDGDIVILVGRRQSNSQSVEKQEVLVVSVPNLLPN